MSASADELDWMRRAVQLASQCKSEVRDGRDTPPKVGAVIVKEGTALSSGYRGMTAPGRHAEFEALRELEDHDLLGAHLYTTLEPCTERNPPKIPCAQRVIESGIRRVYIGSYDPNPVVYRLGWKRLREAGIELRDFDRRLREEVERLNEGFIAQYRRVEGNEGRATFDYKQNGGIFEIEATSGVFTTRWGGGGARSMHAYGHQGHVAHARYATDVADIDDPAVFDFSNHVVSVSVREVVVFPDNHGWLLVSVEAIKAPVTGERTSVTISWEARRLDGSRPS